jgi:hypothetical protein
VDLWLIVDGLSTPFKPSAMKRSRRTTLSINHKPV